MLPDGRIISHAPKVTALRPLPAPAEFQRWNLAKAHCLLTDGAKCVRQERVFVNNKGRAAKSSRATSNLMYEEVCYQAEMPYVDENGTIWGGSVDCYVYVYDDGSTPPIIDNGGGGGGGGTVATTTTTCAVPGASALVNSIIANSPRDQALLAKISASNGPNAQPTFTETNLPPGTVAQADWANHTVQFDSSQIQAAINDGQDIGQIVEHELLHLWLETADNVTGTQAHPFPAVGAGNQVIVTLDDGTTMTFDQTATRNAATGRIDLSTGYTGYEHILIHQILVNENPGVGDLTGAMKSAYLQASSVTLPGGQPQRITDDATAKRLADAHKKSNTDQHPPAPPADGAYNNCQTTTTTSVARATHAVRRTHEVIVFNGDTYDVPWDGAIY